MNRRFQLRVKPLLSTACLTASLSLVIAASSSAAPVTVGQLAPPNPPPSCNTQADIFQTAVSSGSTYIVPPGYTTLGSWSTNASVGAGQLIKMKVFRKVLEPNFYKVVAVDPRSLVPGVLNTFSVNIPVEAGDYVGLNDTNAATVEDACIFSTTSPLDTFAGTNTDFAAGDGGPMPTGGTFGRVNVAATLYRPAAIAAVTPASGSIKGGTVVTISGSDFTGASAVSFGAVPAAGFVVNSDSTVTATTPAGALGAVDISVTTPAGKTAAVAADQFSYTACVVPKLKGRKLKGVGKALAAAGCSLGMVKGKKGKTARVKSQSDRPGSILAPGTKVNVRLGSKAHHQGQAKAKKG